MSAEAKRVPSIGKDDKNFRSHYYEKVGFRGVDERKTLDVLLQEDPFNIDKFCNFGQKCTIPYNDRINVWKIILGVVPRHHKNKESYWKWKLKPYEDSWRFMKSAARIDEAWPKAKSQTVLYLLFNNELRLDFRPQLEERWSTAFTAVSESMLSICRDHKDGDADAADLNLDVEAFYLAKGLVDSLRKHPSTVFSEAVTEYHKILANSSTTDKLYGHLEKIGLNEEIPLKIWFSRGFAGVLATPSLEKVWDKVISGSLKILVFVAVALVDCTKMALQGCQTSQEAVRCLISTSEEVDEMVVQNAIDMWMDDGCQALPGDKNLHHHHAKMINNNDNSKKTTSSTSQKFKLDPDFKMATVIKIGPMEDLDPINE